MKRITMDALTVFGVTAVAGIENPAVANRDALMAAVAAGGAVVVKALNPKDPSYGVGSQRGSEGPPEGT